MARFTVVRVRAAAERGWSTAEVALVLNVVQAVTRAVELLVQAELHQATRLAHELLVDARVQWRLLG